MEKANFDFIKSYRTLSPSASREIVDARFKSHERISEATASHTELIFVACQMAFQLDISSTSKSEAELIEKSVREFDPQFSLELDKAEAARIASLFLRNLLAKSDPKTAFLVLVSSFCGRRRPLDEQLLRDAAETVTSMGRTRHIKFAPNKIITPELGELKAELDAVQAFNQNTVRSLCEAIVADYSDGIEQVASSANEVISVARKDFRRMAEELDMLWWHIGDWSELLHQPRAQLSKETVAIVSGLELGDMIREMPGPHGVYGILRRALKEEADKTVKLSTAINSLSPEYGRLAAKLPTHLSNIFPVHAALQLADQIGAESWNLKFNEDLEVSGLEISCFDLAVQTLRERVLIDECGFKS